MQATESHAAGQLLGRLRTTVDGLHERVFARARDNTATHQSTPGSTPLSLEERNDDLETIALPDDWDEVDLEEAGIR